MLKYIRKTCPCNKYPLIPQFYIVKQGYAGVYLFFLFFVPKHRLLGASNVYLQCYVLSKNKKNIKIFQFLKLKILLFIV